MNQSLRYVNCYILMYMAYTLPGVYIHQSTNLFLLERSLEVGEVLRISLYTPDLLLLD